MYSLPVILSLLTTLQNNMPNLQQLDDIADQLAAQPENVQIAVALCCVSVIALSLWITWNLLRVIWNLLLHIAPYAILAGICIYGYPEFYKQALVFAFSFYCGVNIPVVGVMFSILIMPIVLPMVLEVNSEYPEILLFTLVGLAIGMYWQITQPKQKQHRPMPPQQVYLRFPEGTRPPQQVYLRFLDSTPSVPGMIRHIRQYPDGTRQRIH
jgi:hypothetical protein